MLEQIQSKITTMALTEPLIHTKYTKYTNTNLQEKLIDDYHRKLPVLPTAKLHRCTRAFMKVLNELTPLAGTSLPFPPSLPFPTPLPSSFTPSPLFSYRK
jgi:hypothetical protein